MGNAMGHIAQGTGDCSKVLCLALLCAKFPLSYLDSITCRVGSIPVSLIPEPVEGQILHLSSVVQ